MQPGRVNPLPTRDPVVIGAGLGTIETKKPKVRPDPLRPASKTRFSTMQKPRSSTRPQPPSSTNSEKSENERILKKTKQSQITATSPAESEVEIQITGETITNTPATSTQKNPIAATATSNTNSSSTTTTNATVSKGSENPSKKIQSQRKTTSNIWKHFKAKGKESAFSTGGRVLSDSRNRLKPATLEALICGQDWIFTNEGLNKSQAVTGDVAEYDLSGSD
ncbi:hypothetical protein PCASD_07341 [Puccinia coronata f. sp. avenae]|uniref:HAT C-terminal dimerisation domain-containing protein n=1 Tax=Puccinia coronata f. sp. avenae TaxID=200324 RepID=A0A2N5UT46_9BASI|nr:hypothetical protein PCASD_07341 [Puccinia coronata f. sp. avenae]